MLVLRRYLLHHRTFATWLLAAALLMKAVVPSGYMVSAEHGSLSLELCSGYGPVATAVSAHAMAHHHHPDSEKRRQGTPCPFAALSAPSLSAADPVLLATAIAFIALVALRAPVIAPTTIPDFLRPPPRGPPLRA